MAKLVKSACPECGARLQVDPEMTEVKCEYCGSVAQVRDKKKKQPPASFSPEISMRPVITVSTGASWTWIFYLIFPLVMVMGIGGFTWMRSCSSLSEIFGGIIPVSGPGAGGSAGQGFGEHMQWVGHRQPMLVDANGDGAMDVIGWIRFLNMSGGTTFDHIGAFNAVNGDRLWDTGAIADSSQSYNVKVGLTGDKLLVADAAGVLKAYSIYNGQMVWTGMLGERAERICGDAQGFARVETKDKRALRVALANGQISPAGTVDGKTDCSGIQTDEKKESLYYRIAGGTWDEGGIVNPEIDGMRVESVLVDKYTNATIALGSRSPGTGIPTVALYNKSAISKKSKKVTPVWLTAVPAVNVLTVKEDAPEVAGIVGGRIVIPYEMMKSDTGWRMASLDVNTGRNLWDVAIPLSGTGGVGGMALSDRQIFITHWTYLDVFNLGTGQHQFTIGVW